MWTLDLFNDVISPHETEIEHTYSRFLSYGHQQLQAQCSSLEPTTKLQLGHEGHVRVRLTDTTQSTVTLDTHVSELTESYATLKWSLYHADLWISSNPNDVLNVSYRLSATEVPANQVLH